VQQLLNDTLELKIRMLKELDELILKRQRDQGLS
jgi:general secretion pathway protein A